MKRLVRHLVAMSVVSLSGLVAAETAPVVAAVSDTPFGFLEKKAPWLHAKMNAWRHYLAEKPTASVARPYAAEEVSFRFSHSWAANGYGPQGYRGDASVVPFGRDSFPLKDAFVASKMLLREEAKVVSKISDSQPLSHNSRHFLYLLADQNLAFRMTQSRQEFQAAYSRSFWGNKLQIQVHVPIVRQEVNLDLAPAAEITRENRGALVEATTLNSPLIRSAIGEVRSGQAAPGFYESYSDMNNFLHHTLQDCGISFAKKQEEVSVGDIAIGCQYEHVLPYVDRCQVGAQVVLNTAKNQRHIALAESAFGHGAHQLKTSALLSWHRGSYANPFMEMSLGYSLPTQAGARVPYALSHDGMSHMGERLSEVYPRSIAFSDVLMLGGAPFSHYAESQVPGFASSVHKVTVHKGLSCLLHVGNVIEECFGKPMHVSISYRFSGQQQDRISGIEGAIEYAPEVLTRSSGARAHDLLLSGGYRLSKLCSVEGGLEHRFAGKNVVKNTRVWGGMQLQF